MKGSNVVKSVKKTMKIYEDIVDKGSPVSLSTISEDVDINISTVHRLINTLAYLGYLEQNEDGLYQLGIRSYKLANIINENFQLKKIVRPYLEEIVESCNETANLVIFEDNQVVYIDQVESTNMVHMFADMGSKGPAYCTGAGKVLLAFQPIKKINSYMEEVEFVRWTKNTVTNPVKLKEELKKIRNNYYALDLEEKEPGVCCAAAPIFGMEKKIAGAISVSGPSTRITEDYLHKTLIPLVKNKAKLISSRLKE